MKNYILLTGSVTLAQKGKEFLQRRGINATLRRVQSGEIEGCGYGVVVTDRALALAKTLFAEERIPIKAIRELSQ